MEATETIQMERQMEDERKVAIIGQVPERAPSKGLQGLYRGI